MLSPPSRLRFFRDPASLKFDVGGEWDVLSLHRFKRPTSKEPHRMPLDETLGAAWQAEAAYIQWLVFSIVLVTLALTFHHTAKQRHKELAPRAVAALSLGLSLLAAGVGATAIFSYFTRMKDLQISITSERKIHVALLFFGCLVILSESIFATTIIAS